MGLLTRAAILICGLSGLAAGQTLARPGWVGSGLTANVWWKHAVVYGLDPRAFRDSNGDGVGDLRGVVSRLDYLRSLGVVAVLLEKVQPAATPGVQGIDPAIGTVEDFDELVGQAIRQGLRVIVEIQPGKAGEDLSGAARFWLSRGVAGLSLAAGGDAVVRQEEIRQFRAAASGYVGERVVIGDAGAPGQGRDGPQLAIAALVDSNTAVSAGALRSALAALDASPGGPVRLRSLEIVGAGDAARGVAAVLYGGQGGVMIQSGEELGRVATAAEPIAWGTEAAEVVPGKKAAVPVVKPFEVAGEEKDPKSMLNWYRQVGTLMQGNATLRTGADILLNHDDKNVLAWIRRPAAVSYQNPAIVVVCNFSGDAVTVSLQDDVQRLRMKGNFLKTIVRSDEGMGPMGLSAVKVPGYGVYIGELKY